MVFAIQSRLIFQMVRKNGQESFPAGVLQLFARNARSELGNQILSVTVSINNELTATRISQSIQGGYFRGRRL